MADCQEFLRLGSDARLPQDETAVLYFWLSPGTYVVSREESLHSEFVVHLTKGENVLGQRFGVDQNFINVRSSELPHVLEDVVHRLFKCRWGIAEAERNHQVGKCTILGSEWGSLYMIRVYPNLVEPQMKVDLAEN